MNSTCRLISSIKSERLDQSGQKDKTLKGYVLLSRSENGGSRSCRGRSYMGAEQKAQKPPSVPPHHDVRLGYSTLWSFFQKS